MNVGPTVPISEAAKDLLGLLDWVERRNECAVLTREGKPVATLTPLPRLPLSGSELAERWPKLDKLDPEEARSLAEDIESDRIQHPPQTPSWD